jgi:hypothetical protein
MTKPAYDVNFYSSHERGSNLSALRILSWIFERLAHVNVADYGCGAHGAWLAAAQRLGAKNMVGLDGPWARPQRSVDYEFIEMDPEHSPPVVRRVDLAWSLEVAEHLTDLGASRLIEALVASSDVVIFGAALPGQGGTGHINERLASHWVAEFRDRGFECLDVIRPRFWNDTDIEPWYRQTTFVFL